MPAVIEIAEIVRELKQAAKWGTDSEKKKAVSSLSQYGNQGLSAIQEILSVTAYADVRQACIDAIRSIGRAKAVRRGEDRFSKTRRRSLSRLRTTKKRKNR